MSGQCYGDTHLDIWLRSMDLQARHKGRIEAKQMKVLRRIEGVSRLDRVRKRQQNWKERVEEMSTNRVTNKINDKRVQEDVLEEDRGRDGAVTLINSILSNSHI